MEKRPSIFISSTIYDFQDLRSSLQYWLNEFGFEVRMSDKSDFIKNSNLSSYEACLDSISECDYYLLLIGSRVGGLYSKKPRISITQKEYQCANELAKQGKIKKLFIFVRRNLWDIKEDRKALEQLIKSEHINNEELSKKEKIMLDKSLYHKSKFVNDANFVFSFIDEVSKAKEMKEALENDITEFPSHNWINIFNDFKDIIDVLKAELKIEFSLSRKRWDELICENLSNVLSLFLSKSVSGNIAANCYSVKDILSIFPEIENENYKITERQGEQLLIFAIINQLDMKNLSYALLQSAAQTGIYLKYDAYKSDFRISVLQKALLELIENLDLVNDFYKSFVSNTDYVMKLKKTLNPDIKSSDGKILLNSSDINITLAVQQVRFHHNIIELCRYIFACLKDNREYPYPTIYTKNIFNHSLDDMIFSKLSPEEIYEYMIGST